MKKQNTILALVAGIMLGAGPSLYLGLAQSPRKNSPHLQIVAYPAGTTGIYDPDSGRIYVYDINLVNCLTTREVTSLGQPLRRLKN